MKGIKVYYGIDIDKDYTEVIPFVRLTIAKWEGFCDVRISFSFLSLCAEFHVRKIADD